MSKIKCECGKIAVWIYMPSDSDDYPYYCDDCVPRGCSCNCYPKDDDYDNSDPDNWIEELDEKGRKQPCCEYEYFEEGFEEEEC